MSRFVLRLPEDLHARLKEQATKQGVSMNQFLLAAASRMVAGLEAKELFAERARSFDEERFKQVLAKVRNRPPLEGDELEEDTGSSQRKARKAS